MALREKVILSVVACLVVVLAIGGIIRGVIYDSATIVTENWPEVLRATAQVAQCREALFGTILNDDTRLVASSKVFGDAYDGILERYLYSDEGKHWWSRITYGAESTWTYDHEGNPLQRQVSPTLPWRPSTAFGTGRVTRSSQFGCVLTCS